VHLEGSGAVVGESIRLVRSGVPPAPGSVVMKSLPCVNLAVKLGSNYAIGLRHEAFNI
jgi:hypothetical protein